MNWLIFIFVCILYSHLYQLILRKLHFLIFILVKIWGDHLSMGTELVGDCLSRETNQFGTHCAGPNVCGPYAFGIKCVTAFISTHKNIKFSLDLIDWFLFSFDFEFSLISIHLSKYKESWECSIDIKNATLLDLYFSKN